MSRVKSFLKTTLLGGVIVLLPLAILLYFAIWMVRAITDVIHPLTDLLTSTWDIPEYIASIIIIVTILLALFFMGAIVKTTFGANIWKVLENKIMRLLPGYSMIKETIVQVFATDRPPFSSVALVQVSGDDGLETGFVTDEHSDGSYTVFVPTGPNPMSGNIYHLKQDQVHIVDVPFEVAWKSVISCGADSKQLLSAYQKERP